MNEPPASPAPPEPPVPPPAPGGIQEEMLRTLNENVARLAARLEQSNTAELAELSRRPFKLLWVHFLAGLSRGIGLFIGGGVMGALTIALLSWATYHLLQVFNMFPVLQHFAQAVGDVLKQFLQQHPAKKP